MIPGKLNKIIEIQKQTAGSPDASGGPTVTWSTHAKVWAGIEPLRGRDLITANALKSEGTVMFTTRYVAGVLAGMRIVFDGQYYNIDGPPCDVGMKHEKLQILCRVGVNDGN